MKKIALTQGQFALVDDEDFEFLSQWNWYADWKPTIRGFYACRKSRYNEPNPRKTVLMHRVIMRAPKGTLCDHRDLKTLNNLKSNLRLATYSQNNMNRRGKRNSTSGFKGVYWHGTHKVWCASIAVNGVTVHLGTFKDPKSAHAAYISKAKEHYGEFARLA